MLLQPAGGSCRSVEAERTAPSRPVCSDHERSALIHSDPTTDHD